MITTTTYAEYDKEYTAFAIKHNKTAERKEYSNIWGDTIRKMICWTDGATWWEITDTDRVEEVEVETEIHGIKVTVKQDVHFRRTEYWSTENSRSRFFYEKA